MYTSVDRHAPSKCECSISLRQRIASARTDTHRTAACSQPPSRPATRGVSSPTHIQLAMNQATGEADCVSMSHRFEILDEVLNDFMNSNECRYTMPQMLALPENTIEYIKFFRRDIPYLATVSMYNILGFASKRKLVIQLPSCDFLFKEREGTPVPRQKSPTWISMPEALDHFTGLLDITPDHDKGMCFYNFAAQGVDVIMVSSHSSAPDVMVSY